MYLHIIKHKYAVEIGLISCALLITITAAYFYFQGNGHVLGAEELTVDTERSVTTPQKKAAPSTNTIAVDVSGAVLNPDVYVVKPGARLKDLIDLAGGLTDQADTLYVARNFNMSKLVGDQEKIYIPYSWDIAQGTFSEEKRILEYLQPLYLDGVASSKGTSQTKSAATNAIISLNTSTAEELDVLPGIGPTTAKKIIDNRPYESVEELLSKKVVKQSVFDEIKELVTP